MISFIRTIFGVKKIPKYDDINWTHYYYNSLAEKVMCIIFDEDDVNKNCVVYNEYKCKVRLKKRDILDNDYVGSDEHRFI